MARPVQNPLTARLPAALSPGDRAVLDDDVEWSGMEIRGDFSSRAAQQVDVSECRGVGSSLTAVDLRRVRVSDAVFVDCELSGATFHEAVLTRVQFAQCRMVGFSLPQ